jgi:hypothetical protein
MLDFFSACLFSLGGVKQVCEKEMSVWVWFCLLTLSIQFQEYASVIREM